MIDTALDFYGFPNLALPQKEANDCFFENMATFHQGWPATGETSHWVEKECLFFLSSGRKNIYICSTPGSFSQKRFNLKTSAEPPSAWW